MALERGLRVLDLLIELERDPARRGKGLGVQQVATEMGIHKSTASRLMQTLVAAGYAQPLPEGRRGFRLGPAAQLHLLPTHAQRQLAWLARPHLARLVGETGECAHVAVASGLSALVIEDVETSQPLRVVSSRGRRVPLHCTSAGKCLLAFGLAAVPAELPRRTPRTITAPELLRAQLQEIAARGYAVDDEENDLGVRCVSAPVFSRPGGEALGCIGIDGPSVRVRRKNLERLAGHVVAIAAELTGELTAQASARDLAS